MEKKNSHSIQSHERRRRLHELVIALIHQQEEIELMDADAPRFDGGNRNLEEQDPARWIDRNRRVLKKYQALVRSAITLETLLESELSDSGSD